MQLLCPARGTELLHYLATIYGFNQHVGLPEPRAQHLSETPPHLCHAGQALPPSCLQLLSFSAQPRNRRKALRAVGWEASSTTLLTPCSSSTLQIWRIFSFAAVSTLSRGPGKEGQTAAAFLQKRAFAACLSAEGQCPAPLRQADSISSVWHLHSALELCSYVNVRQSGDIVQIL